MVNLALAVLSSALVSIIMRFSEGRSSGSTFKLAANYLMCLVLAAYYTGWEKLFSYNSAMNTTLLMGIVNGVLYMGSFLLLQLNVRRNGVVLSATFMKLGLLVPMAISALVFGELPTAVQGIGFILAVTAIILINVERESSVMKFGVGLILLLIAGGSADAMSKVFDEMGNSVFSERFLLYTFASALLLCLIVAVCRRERLTFMDILFGLLIGIPNYYSARFLLKALGDLPAVIVYPSYSVATIVVVTLTGLLIFQEKLGKRQKYALFMIIVALVLLNL